jgi:hypothetical protein
VAAASDPHVVAYVASWEGTNSTALKGVTDAMYAVRLRRPSSPPSPLSRRAYRAIFP